MYNVVGGQNYKLASSISSTDDEITLSSFLEPVTNTPLTMENMNTDIFYFTISPGTSTSEFGSATGVTQNDDGTATITGIIRGLAKKDPFTVNSAYALPHSGQSVFILSDLPQLFNKFSKLEADNEFTGDNEFTNLSPTIPTEASDQEDRAASIGYVNDIAIAGAPDASATTKGITKLSTAPDSPTNPIAVGDNDPRIPTSDQGDALDGTVGLPSTFNPYVTDEDTELNSIDQFQTTQNATVAFGEADATTKKNKISQSFIPLKETLTGVVLYKSANTGTFVGDVTIKLQGDSAGEPNGTPLATVTITNATYNAFVVGRFVALFASPYVATAGTTYWIVASSSSADNSNHPNIGTNSAGGYADGSVKYFDTTDGWTAIATIDLFFQILMDPEERIVRLGVNQFATVFPPYAADSGASDTYSVNVDGISAYVTGHEYLLKLPTTNTSAATLNVNNLGAKSILRPDGSALATGDIAANQFVTVSCNGTAFLLTSPVANSPKYFNFAFTKDASDASVVQNIPHGFGRAPRKVTIFGAAAGPNGFTSTAYTVYDGTQYSSSVYVNGSGTNLAAATFSLNTASSAVTQTGVLTTDVTNIIITWTKTGGATGSYPLVVQAEC